MKIGIISGSLREGRKSTAVAQWVLEHAAERDSAEFEVLEVADFGIPVLTTNTHPMQAKRQYESEAVQKWGAAVDAFDAYVFVTPEYNHGVPGGFKNAVDSLGPEWVGKAVGFVSYGSAGGTRAVEQWRQIMGNFNAYVVRNQVTMSIFTDWKDGDFRPAERYVQDLNGMLDQLVEAAAQLG